MKRNPESGPVRPSERIWLVVIMAALAAAAGLDLYRPGDRATAPAGEPGCGPGGSGPAAVMTGAVNFGRGDAAACPDNVKFLMGEKMDLNRAQAQDLDLIPGIGPVTAERIVSARERARFQTWEELNEVPGLSPEAAASLRLWTEIKQGPEP